MSVKREDRKRELLDAAIELFGRRGYHATQVSDIISKAKVARGTFYLYFKGKREIFDSVMTELFEQVRHEVRSLPRDAVDKIPEQLWGNIERVTSLLLTRRPLARLLFSAATGVDAALDRRLQKFYEQILDLIRRGLRQGQEMGFVRDGDIPILAVSLLGCFKEVFYQVILGKDKPDQRTIVREVFRTVVRAIGRPEIVPTIESGLLRRL